MTKTDKNARRSFSPAPYMVAGYLTVFLGFGIFGTWAATAPLASGVVGKGVVSLEGNRKTIQHLEGGIVSDIVAKEGDIVNAGDVLLKLDPTQARGNYALWNTKLLYLQATEARLIAESTGADKITFPENVLKSDLPEAQAAMKMQTSLFNDRVKSRDGKVAILNARVEQLRQATKGFQDQLNAIDKQIDSMTAELERLDSGMTKGVVSANQHSQMTRGFLSLQSNRGEIEADMAKTRETISEAELQIVQTRQEFVERAVSEHKDTQDQLSEVTEKVRVTKDILSRTTVTAPVRGMVQNVKVYTDGGVVRPAEPLMDIVPLDDDLMIRAQVSPIDIDNVKTDARVEVRFSSFSSKTTPAMFGHITVLSKDVIEPTAANQQPYYLALVKVEDKDIPQELKGRLIAGMPAEVVISTGERTFAQYIVKPLVDSFHKSLKEK